MFIDVGISPFNFRYCKTEMLGEMLNPIWRTTSNPCDTLPMQCVKKLQWWFCTMAHFLQMISVCDPYLGISPILGVRLLSFASSLSSCFFSSSETSLHRIPLHCLPAARKYKDQTGCSKGNPLWDRNRECVGGVKIKIWGLDSALPLSVFFPCDSQQDKTSPPPTFTSTHRII